MSDTLAKPPASLAGLLSSVDVKKRFDEILHGRGAAFVSSIMSLYNATPQLQQCEPGSILQAAIIAATLDLPINQNLGFAFIIPYGNRAQFQMGWKGFVQLAIRTSKYKTVNASEVYRDEIASWNPLTGVFEATPAEQWIMRRKGDFRDVVGYMAFFRLLNGFEKTLYMTDAELVAHGKKYSKSYDKGMWTLNPHVMKIKTVIKLLLSKYGLLSVQMEKAMEVDQAVVDTTGEISYDDRPADVPVPSKPSGATRIISEAEFKLLCARSDDHGIDEGEVKAWIKKQYGKEHRKDLTVQELTEVLKWIEQDPEQQKP